MKDTASTINAFNHSRISDKTASFSLFEITTTTVGFIFKTFLWLGFLGGTMLVLQLASLEICSRAGIFPLYGFYFTNLLYAVFLVGIYRISKRGFALPTASLVEKLRNSKGRIRLRTSPQNIGHGKSGKEQIPAVLLIVRHRKEIQTKKENKVSA